MPISWTRGKTPTIADLLSFALDHLSSAKIIAGGFSISKFFLPFLAAFTIAQNFSPHLKIFKWFQDEFQTTQVAHNPDLVFALYLTEIYTDIPDARLGSDHKIVFRNLTEPPTNRISANKTTRHSFCATVASVLHAQRTSNRNIFFLIFYPQLAAV